MIQIHKTPEILKNIYPKLTWKRPSENEIFLTFDDGPHPEVTPWVLQELNAQNAKATFFCVGENIEKHTEVASRVVEEGHVIANHTFNHMKGWRTPTLDYVANIRKCDEIIRDIQPLSNKLFRPPYGRIRRDQIRRLAPKYEMIMWSHLSWDFDKNMSAFRSLRRLKKAQPGSIIVFHDSEKAFKNLQALLPPLLSFWNSQNYKFSTL